MTDHNDNGLSQRMGERLGQRLAGGPSSVGVCTKDSGQPRGLDSGRYPPLRGRHGWLAWLYVALTMLLAPAMAFADDGIAGTSDEVLPTSKIGRFFAALGPGEGQWSAYVVDLKDARPLIAHAASSPQHPASTAKLLATAFALHALGPEHRFTTRVLARSVHDGVVQGPLILLGGGDPNLSSRVFPFSGKTARGPLMTPMQALAAQLWEAGVRSVPDGLVADARLFAADPAPAGWTEEDRRYWYGAPVTALSFNDAMVETVVRPAGRAGLPAVVTMNPNPLGLIRNAVTTIRKGQPVETPRIVAEGDHWVLTGSVAMGKGVFGGMLAQPDPPLMAAMALKEALENAGIRVGGNIGVRSRPPGSPLPPRPFYPGYQVLGERVSPPLGDAVAVVNKVSENTHAEILLRDAGVALGGDGGLRDALAREEAWLRGNGIIGAEAYLEDGCGLSRDDRLSALDLVRMLAFSYRASWGESWRASLPVGAEDGTLRSRFHDLPVGTVRAKTGTLDGVQTLAGLIHGYHGQDYAFAILVNGYRSGLWSVRRRMDDLVRLLAVGRGPALASR